MRVHFIAIGGSAMHNLAIALHLKGFKVSGSDDEIFEPASSRLRAHRLLPAQLGWFPEKIVAELDAVILGMHARADNPELLRAQELGLTIYSFPEYLYQQSLDKTRVVVAGSHGKTTITAMILHALKAAGMDADFMVGASIPGFDVMVRLSEDARWMVLEGDEYLSSAIDRVPKFWHYHPHIAVLSGIGWDHVNVFPTYEIYLEQFREFIRRIPTDGVLIYNQLDEEVHKLALEARCRTIPYTLPPYATGSDGMRIIDAQGHAWPFRLIGLHNLSNLMAAREVCRLAGLSDEAFFAAMSGFSGAARRLELIHDSSQLTVYRDFAHAPSKLKASIEALRLQYPHRRLVICFELHTYSSLSADFMPNYHGSLNPADAAAIFYDPHAVALKRLELVSPDYIHQSFGLPSASVLNDAEALKSWLIAQYSPGCVIGLMSSGSFNKLDVNALIAELEK
ncbi:MAG: peptidoglycan synthetase [Bacteroidetes bacterium]|nr:peptidoglycan synthetase [Bacteroidota bacterium]